VVSFTDKAGKLDPENIRGWMTLAEISTGTACLSSGFLPKLASRTREDILAVEYGRQDLSDKFEPDKVREIVRNHLAGKPVSPVPVQPAAQSAAVSPPRRRTRPVRQEGRGKKGDGKKDHGSGEEPEVKVS